MKKNLNKDLLVQIIREEWNKKYNNFMNEAKEVGLGPKTKSKKYSDVLDVLSVGTRIKHKKTGIEYTVVKKDENGLTLSAAAVSPTGDVKQDMEGPEFTTFVVPMNKVGEYVID
jgi:hypothetical protein